MNKNLLNFISNLRDNSQYYTHTSQLNPTVGKFNIGRDKMEDFWTVYCNEVLKDNDKFMAGLSERPREYMPILGDIDIAFPYDDEETKIDEHFYKQKHVRQLVRIYLDVIKYIINDEYDNDHLVCFVLEKKKPYVSGSRVKNGFHLHFPFIYMNSIDQDMHLIPRIIKRVEEENLFQDIGIEHSGDVIDKSCNKKHWLMYGSRKDMKLEAYRVTQIFDHKGNITSLENAMKGNKLFTIDEEEINLSTQPIEYFLPRILSVHPLGRQVYSAKTTIEVIPKKQLQKAENVKKMYENQPVSVSIELAKKLVPLIAPHRADNHDEWMQIGWILYNIGDGCQEALELWIQFSRTTTKEGTFSEAECVYRWEKMTKRDLSMGSLKRIAKLDNPTMYEQILQEEQKKLIDSSLLGGEYDIAKQLYDKYSSQFVCADLEGDKWYEFKEHRWQKVQKGITLRTKISQEIIPKYLAEVSRLCAEAANENEEGDKALTKQGKLYKIIGSLKKHSFKTGVMKECQELFYKEGFEKKLDQDAYLIHFTNGVYDLKTSEFREGRPEDYLSMTTGYDYREFDYEDEEIAECKDLLFKIFPDDKLRQYNLEFFAKLLKSGNNEKIFMVFSGVGDNGKSILMTLMRKVLGDYMCIPPTTLLTGKESGSSSASPELAMTRNKKFVVINEPGGKDTMNPGMLKRLTGDEDFYARGLFKDSENSDVQIKCSFKLGLVCNKLPKLEAEDPAIWTRTRVSPFEACFPKDPTKVPEKVEDQIKLKIFPRDDKLNEKLQYMKQAFMWVLIQTYNRIQRYGSMRDPEKVTSASTNYRKNNDVFLQFVNDKMIQDDSISNPGITLSEIYIIFKEWYHESFSGGKIPSKNELKEDLFNRWGPARGNKWKSWRLKSERDLEDEGEVLILRPEDYIVENTTEEEEEISI